MLSWLFGGDESTDETIEEITRKTNCDRVDEGLNQALKAVSIGQDPSDILEEVKQIFGSIKESNHD